MLVEEQSFGDESVPADSTIVAGGATLGHATGIAVGPDHAVYVVDRDYKKIVVFEPDGSLRRVIPGGLGEGPGEFRLPIAIDVWKGQFLAVYDYALGRVTVFDLDGTYLYSQTIPVAGSSFVVAKGRIWVARRSARASLLWSNTLVREDSLGGGRPEDHIPLTAADLAFSQGTAHAVVGRGSSGTVLAAAQEPAIWFANHDSEFVRYGMEMIPGATTKLIGGFSVDPAHTRGIGGLIDGRVVLAWQEWLREEPRARIGAIWIEVFDSSGGYLGSAQFPSLWMDSFATDPSGDAIYAGLSDPFPRVVRYRLSDDPLP